LCSLNPHNAGMTGVDQQANNTASGSSFDERRVAFPDSTHWAAVTTSDLLRFCSPTMARRALKIGFPQLAADHTQ